MKVLYIITGLGMGGAENQVISLSQEMIKKGHNVEIISLKRRPIQLKPSDDKIIVHELDLQFSFFSFFYSLSRLFNLINEISPNIIHSHMIHANLVSRIYKFFNPKIKLVCTAHNTIEGGNLGMLLYRLTDKYCDFFSNVSNEAVEAFQLNGATKLKAIQCIYNGIDEKKFYFDKVARLKLRNNLGVKNKRVLLAVGRFNNQKDYPNLIDAFSKLKQNDVDDLYKLFIVGDGPLKEGIQELIITRELCDHISLLGIRHDINQLMSAADCFVLSSAWEGFGLVVAESMSCNLPVVATDCGGVSEVVGGYWPLVEPKNSQALCDAILNVFGQDKEKMELTVKNAREYILKNFSLFHVSEKWQSVYTEIVG